ncbi:hypothetical protein FBY31_1901 [Arthrobacter sp. SLBN-100]|uniref:hypothetical protein n=1 Tax=Arthrobacter sp. SLBN-100 TaxID=2768450 RepID=UPI00114F90D8|nr:hypothetical protein [Arthrobacter sp. SLBN-100]TQJ67822.1 hypothetical protein FBY31_1901 [Arthrobacter sp. SLBN-100]
MSTEEYLKALAYELRQRKHSEDMVRNRLQEVVSYLAESGESGEAAFGPPREYAASFPAGTSTSRGARVGTLAAGLVILMLGVYLVLRGMVGVSFGVSGTLSYFAAVLVLTAVLVFTGKFLDRRLPDVR